MARSRRRTFIVLLACGLLCLVVAVPAFGKLTAVRDGDTVNFTGTDGDDVVDMDVVPGLADPNQRFIQVHDPDGIDPLPEGCFRKDANTIHCPLSTTVQVGFDLKGGNDTLIIDFGGQAEFPDVDADGGDGNDNLEGSDEADNFKGGAGKDVEKGGAGNDNLDGGDGNDKQNGGAGNDKLKGGKGKDTQKGGPGKDQLVGGAGNDKQIGGGGKDRCNGGGGSDTPISCEIGFAY